MNIKQTIEYDKKHIWHPYTSMKSPLPSYLVESAEGVEIRLSTGENLIDGMASWWSVIHGYNQPELNKALQSQAEKVSHVMFGGLTHEPAVSLCRTLIDVTPQDLQHVFLSDSGSVSVEVAIKMAYQYWIAKKQPQKSKLLTVKNGYHGDTLATMAVCDPVNGMHSMFSNVLTEHYFVSAPKSIQSGPWCPSDLNELRETLAQNHQHIAAFIIEPIVQGAGGMRFYHPEYLVGVKALCQEFNVLFIADEIATGLGRTGKLFACEWADVTPDIMCLGKTLTGGYMTLAATLCTKDVAFTISESEAGCFMHGPTFMGNPLACAVAKASIDLLLSSPWEKRVKQIEQQLTDELTPLQSHERVASVRVLGAIGVVEATQAVNMPAIQKRFVELGVWIRPFGKLIYIMPPYIINNRQMSTLISAIKTVLSEDTCFNP